MKNQRSLYRERFTDEEIKDMVARHAGARRVPGKINIITDTTDFFRVEYADIFILEDRPYLVGNCKREGRFGMDDQPKFWVKTAIDLISGDLKIIKMVFRESLTTRVGELVFECVRSPRKEARILALTKDHPHFMHGFGMKDSAGNIIRVIDYIYGKTLSDQVPGYGKGHEDYFYNYFPFVLDDYIKLVNAIKFLHDHGEKHGDIRRDHIIKEKEGGPYRWIDFDFNYMHRENMFGYDLFGLGNILLYITGRGDVTTQHLKKHNGALFGRLTCDDLNIVFRNRVVNLKKIYPYIPDQLNNILLHFSIGANIFYDNTVQLLSDLREARQVLVTPDSLTEGVQ
ncbi:MAG: hypothetical protein HZA16_12860 [Nitrospirae bacterium]|nr:hypothetical protein [Nitrospirota bacterium]